MLDCTVQSSPVSSLQLPWWFLPILTQETIMHTCFPLCRELFSTSLKHGVMGNWPSLEKNNPIIPLPPKKKTNKPEPHPCPKNFWCPVLEYFTPPPPLPPMKIPIYYKRLNYQQMKKKTQNQKKINLSIVLDTQIEWLSYIRKLQTSFIWLDKRIMQCLFKEVQQNYISSKMLPYQTTWSVQILMSR